MRASAADPIRVLIVEDEEPLRDAIRDLITGESGLEVAGLAASADEAIALAESAKPDVALVDVRMPGGGPAAARGIAECSPETSVVALSAYDDRATVFEMLQAGAVGYLVKGIAPQEICDAVRRADRGQASFSVEVIGGVVEDLSDDLAERRHVEEVLRRSDERFRALMESSPDATIVADESGRIVLVNELAEQLFGYASGELLGRSIEVLLPEHLREHHLAHRAAYLENPANRSMGAGLQLTGRQKSGAEIPVDISLSTVETDEGRLITARVRDSRESHGVDDVQRGSEDRFAALVETAPDAVVIVDHDGKIVLVNGQTESLFDYDRYELLGEQIEILLPERFHQQHVVQRAGYFADPATRPMGLRRALVGRRKDASEFPVDISLSVLETEEGRLATAFIRDITERKEQEGLERKLDERRSALAHLVSAGEKERQRIAGDIHDDSIQAITAAGMRLQILRRTLKDDEQLLLLAELEQTIQFSISRLRHLLFELRPPVLDTEGLSAALLMYLDEAGGEAGGSEIRYRLEDRLRSQPSEESRMVLYRITQEALTNVRKHAEAGNVTVTLEERQSGYAVRVADDGVGFTVAHATPTPGHLGVAAMRERAELAGGWLGIESAEGQGTTVEFWIPVPAEGRAAA